MSIRRWGKDIIIRALLECLKAGLSCPSSSVMTYMNWTWLAWPNPAWGGKQGMEFLAKELLAIDRCWETKKWFFSKVVGLVSARAPMGGVHLRISGHQRLVLMFSVCLQKGHTSVRVKKGGWSGKSRGGRNIIKTDSTDFSRINKNMSKAI